YYGAGRLNHGDLKWSFDNATDDTDYGVNTALMSALQAYTTSLKGIFGGETEIPETPDEPSDPEQSVDPSEVLLVSFGADGQPSSSVFTVTGNGSSSKGEITVDGVTYSTCLKMESSTQVSFTLAVRSKVTFYFGATETASLKIDGEKITGTGNTYTTTLDAGTHTLAKDKSVNLFLVKIEPLEE
ncbi:MAG: pectate lyase, partial [Prevotella sp.]|nr:pectate lyase [Prevotella sp.]